MQWSVITDSLPTLLFGLGVTALLSASTILLATLLGLAVGTTRAERVPVASPLLRIYIDVFRGTPLIVQMLFAYFGAAYLGFGDIPPFAAALLALVLCEGAYISEIVRAGVEAVPIGQREAGATLGLTGFQVWRRIVLPLARNVSLPPLVGQYVALVKDTSLASVIGVSEFLQQGQYIVGRTARPLEVYSALTVGYFLICFPMSVFAKSLQRRRLVPS